MAKKIAVSGYFIWLHTGHLDYFKKAKELGGKVIAIVNNDRQQILKYSKVIVPLEQRMEMIKAVKYVDKVVPSIDEDESVSKTLAQINPDIFAKGGDRIKDNIPEAEICQKLGIEIVDRLGLKISSSSELMKKGRDDLNYFRD